MNAPIPVPAGWTLHQTSGVCTRCAGTGHVPVEQILTSPDGHAGALIGNASRAQTREMIAAIVAAYAKRAPA